MPRLAISDSDARDIAAFVTDHDGRLALTGDEAAPDPGLATEGESLFRAKDCGSCHAFSGSGLPAMARDASAMGVILAPDLRWTRERVRPERLAAWIRTPRRSAMPHFELTDAESEAIASFLLHTPLEPVPSIPIAERLPLLERRVGYDEVEERVFRKICWHCHAQPDLARGDGGPGMSGGMGFSARRLDLSTYESINSGYLDDEGELTSLFAETADGTPRLVAVLLARQHEVAGEATGALRGMPLGFPPLPPEDIQLVESWVAQGRPR
jgi:mono/diheme cytochrome c family protein